MWIELSDDIKDYLLTINDPLDEAALAINNMFDSMLKGQHIIYASRMLLKTIGQLQYINPSIQKMTKWIIDHYVYVYECKDIIRYRISVNIVSHNISVVSNGYSVPLKYFYDIRETKLLTENETDGDFFLGIYNYIKKEKKLSSMFEVKFENDSGHGGNVASKLLQNVKDGRMVLCILDSDMEMKNSAKGSTYKGANNVYKKNQNDHIIFLKALNVREKENLFSPNLYTLMCGDRKRFFIVLEKFISEENIIKYFDIKDGVRYKKYKINGWKEYYKEVIDELIINGIYHMPCEDEESVDLEYICVEGVGEKLCNDLFRILLCDEQIDVDIIKQYGVNEEDIKQIGYVRENLRSVLPHYLYIEWEDIYNLLFAWGCCIAPKKLPIQYI